MFGFRLPAFPPTAMERATSAVETWVLVIICPDFPQVVQQGAPKQHLSTTLPSNLRRGFCRQVIGPEPGNSALSESDKKKNLAAVSLIFFKGIDIF